MVVRNPLPEGLNAEFSVRQAIARGVSPSRLRAADLSSPFHGARAVDFGNELESRCRAYRAVAPDNFAFSHLTAARLLGIAVPRRFSDDQLHVVVPARQARPRRAGTTAHRTDAPAIAVRGLPVVRPEVVWLQLGTLLAPDELVVAGDSVTRRKNTLAPLESLREVTQRTPRVRGIVAAREALERIRPGTDSPRESWLRLAIVVAGLSEPLVRHTVHHEGYFVGTPDLAYPAEKIAIEYEGLHHQTDRATYEADIDRRELFRRAGWFVVLVTDQRLRNGAGVRAVADALRERRGG